MLAQIIAGTPKWVFGLFFVLAFYGYLQMRTRDAGKPRVLILPIVMILVSLGGVLSSFPGRIEALLAWAAGVALALLANRAIRAPAGVRYDAATRRFHLPGSWVPLALMMAIYFAKYAFGATQAMRPDLVTAFWFVTLLSGIFGCLSGSFLARFLQIWSARGAAARSFAPHAAGAGLEPTE